MLHAPRRGNLRCTTAILHALRYGEILDVQPQYSLSKVITSAQYNIALRNLQREL